MTHISKNPCWSHVVVRCQLQLMGGNPVLFLFILQRVAVITLESLLRAAETTIFALESLLRAAETTIFTFYFNKLQCSFIVLTP